MTKKRKSCIKIGSVVTLKGDRDHQTMMVSKVFTEKRMAKVRWFDEEDELQAGIMPLHRLTLQR